MDNNDNILTKIFIDSTEKTISILGNKYIGKGELSEGFAIASDKRLYLGGSYYIKPSNIFKKTQQKKVIDLKDINGIGYTKVKDFRVIYRAGQCVLLGIISYILGSFFSLSRLISKFFLFSILNWLLLILIIISIPLTIGFFIAYFLKLLDLFEISFGNDKVYFNSMLYDKSEINDFQRKLTLSKDNLSNFLPNETIKSEEKISNVKNINIADEIRKYSDLLKEGLITQDEFDKFKSRL